jgi:hypothetical protein
VSKELAGSKTLALLNSLKREVQSIVKRANKAKEEVSLKSGRERQRGLLALEESAAQTGQAISEAEAVRDQKLAVAAVNFENRQKRIGKAYQSSKELRLKQIDDRLGGKRYELQKRSLQAERERTAHLAENVKRNEDFKAALGVEQQTLSALEAETQMAFKGYSGFTNALLAEVAPAADVQSGDEQAVLQQLNRVDLEATDQLRLFRKRLGIVLFRYRSIWVVLGLALCGLPLALQPAGISSLTYPVAAGIGGGVILLTLGLRYLAQKKAVPVARDLIAKLHRARGYENAAYALGAAHFTREQQRIVSEFESTIREADQELKQAGLRAGEARVACRMTADEKTVRITRIHEERYRRRQTEIATTYQERLRESGAQGVERSGKLKQTLEAAVGRFQTEAETVLIALAAEWRERVLPVFESVAAANGLSHQLFPPWTEHYIENWTPTERFAHAAKLGKLEIDLPALCDIPPGFDPRLTLPAGEQFVAPLCLGFPEDGSLLIETDGTNQAGAIQTLNDVILRLLSNAPPGRLVFTIFDPVGLGQNFAGVMHLADYEEQLINSRIWTQAGQIEQKLAELNEHMEKVIQMYLRNEYRTIAEYNEQAGVIAEKYHFVVVADFPANFSDVAAKRLMSIATSGARCGVYTLIHWDRRLPVPQDFIPDELRKSSFCLTLRDKQVLLLGKPFPGVNVALENPPPAEQAITLVNRIGRSSRDSMRVEVPFEHVMPPEAELWSEDTTTELRVPIGRTGATKLQYLEIGKGTRQHGLIAGKTGSGKSTLFHVIITNLALWCSPDEVEFYLVDFKKGVEFKCYASRKLPHARVVAIESDREFALSVLQRVDDELRRRGDLFRKLGVQDIPGYKRAGGTEKIPRSLLIIDEFQEFFVEDDKIGQTASLLLDRIVRQGRAFGIHVLLGSQTLGGAYTVARTTLGQMVIRIALQCNEADAYLIMDDTNPAPRLLSRPGEGIYNDAAGAIQGNSPFQVVWLPDSVRDKYLTKVNEHALASGMELSEPVVFEGNAPADISENRALAKHLLARATVSPTAARWWLGAPNSIKGPTEALFQRQSGSHLLMVGQREETALGLLSLGLISFAAQYPEGGVRLIFCDATPPGTPEREYLDRVLRVIPQEASLVKPGDVASLMQELSAELKRRTETPDNDSAAPIFLFIHDLQKFGRLRHEEDFGFSSGGATEPNPGAVLESLLAEGARLGIHVIASCDTFNNVSRFLSRKALSEFEMRVLFQMSANDSATLIDTPRASSLGMHRALFYNAHEGYLETFRPYSLPPTEWVEAVKSQVPASRIPGVVS